MCIGGGTWWGEHGPFVVMHEPSHDEEHYTFKSTKLRSTRVVVFLKQRHPNHRESETISPGVHLIGGCNSSELTLLPYTRFCFCPYL